MTTPESNTSQPGTSGSTAADARAHVVMLVANDVVTDSRVKKEAQAVADAGYRVTVLGVAADGRRSLEVLGDVLVVRVPVAFQLRDERDRKRRSHRDWRPPYVGYPVKSAQTARKQALKARRVELSGRPGAGGLGQRLAAARLSAAERAAWLRAGVGNRADKLFRFGWRAWDGVAARTPWPARWRLVHPQAYDYELAFGPLLDQLAPDAVHAHDMHVIGVAVRAAERARAAGRRLPVVYDAHEYVPGLSRYGPRTPRFIAAWAHHEREYIGRADRVVTVSPAIARTLRQRYRLDREPTVVINSPSMTELDGGDVPGLRARVGLAADVPLLVYSGGVTKARGVETAVEALPSLPGVHLAVVSVPHIEIAPVHQLRALAGRLGVADRVHFLDPVRPHEVVAFLSSADVGLIPILRYPSHEMALPNKVFEYAFAGLPVVTSDMPSLTEFMRQSGIGEVYRVGDAADLAAKVRAVLADPAPYRARLERPEFRREVSWEGQAQHLRELYAGLLGTAAATTVPAVAATTAAEATAPHLLIGPSNSAGQGWRWARAVERYAPPATAENLMTESGSFAFRADHVVTAERFQHDAAWVVEFAGHVLRTATHVLFEAARPVLGQARGQLFVEDLPTLRAAGIAAGVILHGSEVRDPRRHRELFGHSPFADPDDPLTQRLQQATRVVLGHLRDFDGPRFVTTPDLLDFVDGAQWLPVVVDVDDLATDRPVLDRPVPVVLHAPSRGALKGSAAADPVLRDLHDRGLIEYRRIEGIAHTELMAQLRDADVVVDQLALGSYGVLACEAMAAGRVTVGHVAEHVRAAIPAELPIVEATPDDLGAVVERLVAEREAAAKTASAGPDYVRRFHDGQASARVLAPFLGVAD
ncbi:glycosyltransferase family 4 protein [Jiangella alba]|uniref:Glycosyltransferase involved in cell wall bisynthesis n=1 Tax=Jiangella alba TaxID=561176 RepID=A0A1H5H3A5_9ACTN|nr:glycosyltransferase family 4 protein [Jiangella alba]SEE22400.1 Glycosyltransferase involved in cell wall bisynthesis [Jiangella alba]